MHQGEFLKKIRLLKGFNQSGVATMLGITQQAYSKMETHARIDEKKFMDIVKKLGCSEVELEVVKNYSEKEKH
jgi:Helix-turn-helix.